MVQIIEEQRKPRFIDQLMGGLGEASQQAATGLPQVFGQRMAQQKQKQAMRELGVPEQILNSSPDIQQQYFKSFAQSAAETPFKEKLQQQKFEYQRAAQEEAEKRKLELQKQEEEKKEGKESQEWEKVFKDLEERIPYTGAAIPFTKSMLAKFPWSKAAQQREFFDVTAFQLERYARAAHTKGALSTKVYQSLLDKLPNSQLTEAQNRGRIQAWKEALLSNKKIPHDLEKLTKTKMKAPNGQILSMDDENVEEALIRGWKKI